MGDQDLLQPSRRLIGLLAGEVKALAAIAGQLDAEMGSGAGFAISSDRMETLQQVDYLKQHLQDIAAILTVVADQAPASWTTNVAGLLDTVQLDCFRQSLLGSDASECARSRSGDVTLF